MLVENFPQTFFVGGTVRDMLLKHNILDIDIATSARPDEIVSLLEKNQIVCDDKNKNFGNIIAKQKNLSVEITTLRQDLKSEGRYPKVKFINSIKADSKRRDFTINALYLSQKTGKISDFYKGRQDLKNKVIKFIGNPTTRIKQDPLRIVRALRLALILNFKLNRAAYLAIKNNFAAVHLLTNSRTAAEIKKIKNFRQREYLEATLNNKKLLDKYFK